jgi:NAD(P)-dependent dehydrogenase (short-subunit alcohol dehydrogenase family)
LSNARNKVVLITGAARGLGSCMARHFAAAGSHVIVTDVHEDQGREHARELGSETGRASFIRLDVTSESDWSAAFASAAAGPGAVDVLVNNAGWYRPNIELKDMSLAIWRRHFEINTDGAFLGCREALRSMEGRGGVILNIASGAGVTAFAQGGAYSASKAAMLMLTRVAAKAGGPHGIRVNAILPGAVPTDMLRGNILPGQTEAEFIEVMRAHHPLGRLAAAEDIARAAVFLCSDEAGAISGACLPVDAGATA